MDHKLSNNIVSTTTRVVALRHLSCLVNYSEQPDLFQQKVLRFELGQLGFKIKNIEEFMVFLHK